MQKVQPTSSKTARKAAAAAVRRTQAQTCAPAPACPAHGGTAASTSDGRKVAAVVRGEAALQLLVNAGVVTAAGNIRRRFR